MLNISHNEITSIDQIAAVSYNSLQILFVSFNKICSLPALKCPNLELLLATDNEVTQLEDFARSELPKLLELRLCRNKVEKNLPCFDLPAIKIINLSQNSVTKIDQFATSSLPALQTLALSDNKIQGTLPVIVWPELKILGLKNNHISDISKIE